jgi:hypothetical protein
MKQRLIMHHFSYSKIATLLKVLSGLILLLFAVSHFLMLRVKSPSLDSTNSVFPFSTNWAVYLGAGILELIIGGICLINRGSDTANCGIAIFVILIVWYRCALALTGGAATCHCLGLLGQAMHLSKMQEKAIPIIVLVVLFLIILPWLAVKAGQAYQALMHNRPTLKMLLPLCIVLCYSSQAQQAIDILGRYDTCHFNQNNGTLFTNQTRHVHFKCTIQGNAWSLYATNLDTKADGYGLRTPWEGLVYDGSNTYTFMPYHVEAMGRSWTVESDLGKDSSIRATISPGNVLLKDYDEYLDIFVLWITYGFCPANLPTNQKDIIEVPLPWNQARRSPTPYGFEWKITPSANKRFISQCAVIYNTNLSLSEFGEIARKEISPPRSLSDRNRFGEMLRLRQKTRNGLLKAFYKCTESIFTNNIDLPLASELTIYDSFVTNYPITTAQLYVTSISAHDSSQLLPPRVQAQTFVSDYRYRVVERESVVPRAEYVLHSNDTWRSDHDFYVLSRPQISSFIDKPVQYKQEKERRVFTWLLLALMLAPLVIMLKLAKSNPKK